MTAFVSRSISPLFGRLFLGLRVTVVFTAIFFTAIPSLAAPQDEAALVKSAQPHLDSLFDPASGAGKKAQAVEDLQTILSKMNALVESSPELKKRVNSDGDLQSEFLELRRSLIEALPEEARKLGIKLDDVGGDKPVKPAKTATAPPPSGGSCPAIPMPNPNDVANKDTPGLVKAVYDAYDKLDKILDEPPGKTLQDRTAQTSRRDQALRDLVITQTELIWSYAGGPPKDEWGALLDARTKFQRDLKAIRGNDAKIMPLMRRLSMLHAQFNNQKRELSSNGKATPSYFQLEADARKTVDQIEALQRDSQETYREFLKIIAPTEKAAKALFRKQLENGLENINDHLQREGHKGPPFQLFKPKTAHEQFLLDQALAQWVTEKLLIIGTRTRSGGWTDFTKFTDFDYSTRGPATCQPAAPEDKDSADEDASNDATEDIGVLFDDVSPAEMDKTACSSGSIVGTLNCKVVEPMRSGAEEF